tara:strand:+ start:687 stop:914 length:228 start_codon:yes stop_codon:yes gene_type:complete
MFKRIGVFGCKAMKSGIKLNNMNFTLDQIEKASKYILEKDKNSLPDWVITKGLIQYLKELEESSEQTETIKVNAK